MLSFLPFILIFVVFYFLLIRPQQRRAREQREQQGNVKPGDKVMLTSGIMAVVSGVEEDSSNIRVEIADGVVVTVVRQAIGQVLPEADETDESTDEADEATDETVDESVEPTQDPGVIVDLDKSKSKDSSN